MWIVFLLFMPLWATLSAARPINTRQNPGDQVPRLVIYYQTTHDSAKNPIPLMPLVLESNIALTHLIISTIHVMPPGNKYNMTLHLNNDSPDDKRYDRMWAEAIELRRRGVKVMAMVGGAAVGSFEENTLDGDDEAFKLVYEPLRDFLREYDLDGLDIDVEQHMSQPGIERLIQQLRLDMGPEFIITLAPVASALISHKDRHMVSLSGFDYFELEAKLGKDIQFYNAQFYNGFGDMHTTEAFDNIVGSKWDPQKIVIGQLTNQYGGSQHVKIDSLDDTVTKLRRKYGEVGGIMGWEYFNSEPEGEAAPWEWARQMTKILRPLTD